MKFIFFCLLLLVSAGVSAQCLVSAPALGGAGWPEGVPASGVGYIRVCPPESYYSPNAACTAGQYWVPFDYNATPIFTNDTLETCDGFWLPTAEDVRSGETTNPPSSSGDVVTAIEDSTLALATAIACLCFFTAMNSWESAAK